MSQIPSTSRVSVCLAVLGLLILPFRVLGQDSIDPAVSGAVSIGDLVSEVRTSNPSLRAERLGADALTFRKDQVSSLPDPTAMFVYQPLPLLTARGSQRTQWRVEQMIPYPGKLSLRGKIADLDAEVGRFEADVLEQDLVFQTKQVYFELYRIQEQIRLIESFQEELTGFEDVASTQYEVGLGMQQSILKAQLERNALSQRLLGLQQSQKSALEALAKLLNRSVDDVGIIQIEEPPQVGVDQERLLEIALGSRPEAAALESAANRSSEQINLARKDFLPDFGFNVTYFDIAAGDIPPSANGRDAIAIGASVKIPLQLGRRRARLQETRLRRNQIEARLEALETSFRTQIADLTNRLSQESEQRELFRDLLIPQAEATRNATLGTYTTGRSDFLDLLDAERMLFTLNAGYVDTQARYLNVTAALERALGIEALSALDTL